MPHRAEYVDTSPLKKSSRDDLSEDNLLHDIPRPSVVFGEVPDYDDDPFGSPSKVYASLLLESVVARLLISDNKLNSYTMLSLFVRCAYSHCNLVLRSHRTRQNGWTLGSANLKLVSVLLGIAPTTYLPIRHRVQLWCSCTGMATPGQGRRCSRTFTCKKK